MSKNKKAILKLVAACLISVGAFLQAAARPTDGWEWMRFSIALAAAVAIPLERTWADYPGANINQQGSGPSA